MYEIESGDVRDGESCTIVNIYPLENGGGKVGDKEAKWNVRNREWCVFILYGVNSLTTICNRPYDTHDATLTDSVILLPLPRRLNVYAEFQGCL